MHPWSYNLRVDQFWSYPNPNLEMTLILVIGWYTYSHDGNGEGYEILVISKASFRSIQNALKLQFDKWPSMDQYIFGQN